MITNRYQSFFIFIIILSVKIVLSPAVSKCEKKFSAFSNLLINRGFNKFESEIYRDKPNLAQFQKINEIECLSRSLRYFLDEQNFTPNEFFLPPHLTGRLWVKFPRFNFLRNFLDEHFFSARAEKFKTTAHDVFNTPYVTSHWTRNFNFFLERKSWLST